MWVCMTEKPKITLPGLRRTRAEALLSSLPESDDKENKPQSQLSERYESFLANANNPEPSLFNSTGTMIQGTIDVFNVKVSDFIGTLDTVSTDISVSDSPLNRHELEKKFQEFRNELTTFQSTFTQQLTDTRDQAIQIDKTLNDFLTRNTEFLKTAVEAGGKFQAVEGRISSLESRLSTLESNKNISWNKTASVVTIIIAILSGVCLSCISIGISIYTALK